MRDYLIAAGALLYVTLALIGARLVAGHLAWTWREAERRRWAHLKLSPAPGGEQWFGAWALALALAAIWPVALIPFLAGRRFAIGAEREAELRRREKHVKTLERELGL